MEPLPAYLVAQALEEQLGGGGELAVLLDGEDVYKRQGLMSFVKYTVAFSMCAPFSCG